MNKWDQRFTKKYAIGRLTFPGIIPLMHLLESSCGGMLMDLGSSKCSCEISNQGHMAELRRQSGWLVKKKSSIWWWSHSLIIFRTSPSSCYTLLLLISSCRKQCDMQIRQQFQF